MDRRQFLFTTFAGAAALAQKSGPEPLLDKGFAAVTKIADGVYATIANSAKGQQCISNGGVIVGRDASVIIEGHFQPAGAALEIEAARMISRAPVRAAIDTHFHFDHSFGNIGYAEQHIPIMAHERVPALMKEQYGDLKGVDKSGQIAAIRQKLEAAATADDKKHLESDLNATQWMCDAIDAVKLSYPGELLKASDLPRKIDLGGLTAVIEFHPGHSPTDLIIRVPDRDVVFTGDLVFNHSYPVCISADMPAWRKVLDKITGYGRGMRIIPGHGALCEVETVRELADLLDDLRSHAERMKRGGASAEEAARRYLVPPRFESFRISSWGWTVGAAIRGWYGGPATA